MNIRTLTGEDAAAFRVLRLLGLKESPSAFGSSYEEEENRSLEEIAARLGPEADFAATLGGFEDGHLIAVAGYRRCGHLKEKHKAFIWGMYVHPDHRGRGKGRELMEALVAGAGSLSGIEFLRLDVESTNLAARKLYQSFGFRVMGSEPRSLFVDGQYCDVDFMILNLVRTDGV